MTTKRPEDYTLTDLSLTLGERERAETAMTGTEQPNANAVRTWLADQFIYAAERTASDLRGLADMIEAKAAHIRQVPSPNLGSAGDLAARIVAQVTAGLATAGLDAVVSAATRYDTETREVPRG